MQPRAIVLLSALLFTACGPMIHGYTVRRPSPAESQHVAAMLDPLLMTLGQPSLRTIAPSEDCKIGFAVVRSDRVNVWSSPATTLPCLRFTVLVTEGALKIPSDHLMAAIAHELGHLFLHHTPQPDTPLLKVSAEHWLAIHAQEQEADRFAIALLKRTRAVYRVGSCQAMVQFLRRSVPDWYGPGISTRMNESLTRRAEFADTECASPDFTSLPWLAPAGEVQ
jgi:hypothetical protein